MYELDIYNIIVFAAIFEFFSGCFKEDNRVQLFCSHWKQIVEYYLRFYETILLCTYFLLL